MNKYIPFILVVLLLAGCSKSPEQIAQETAKSYLEQKHKGSTDKVELISIETKLDTIPEYFNDEVFGGTAERSSLANLASVAISFLEQANSQSAQIRTQMTGRPYSWGVVGGGSYTEEDAIRDITNLDTKLQSLKRTSAPAAAYVAYAIEKYTLSSGHEVESKEIVLLDKNDPTKVVGHQSFYGSCDEFMYAVKFVQANGRLRTDALGNIVIDDWYNVEKFVLSDKIAH